MNELSVRDVWRRQNPTNMSKARLNKIYISDDLFPISGVLQN